MRRLLAAALSVLLCFQAGAQIPEVPADGPVPGPLPTDLPAVLDISSGVTTHVQGIAVNREKGELYYSFTTRFIRTDLKGKVVLLDFHLFALEDSPARILMLRELYNKYQPQGLEIYQVSLDPDEHFWKQQTAALPWVSVREDKGLNSPTLALYNLQGVPEFFVIDRSNSLVGRSQTIKDLDQTIKSLL